MIERYRPGKRKTSCSILWQPVTSLEDENNERHFLLPALMLDTLGMSCYTSSFPLVFWK